MKVKILCEVCDHHIANADTDTLRVPFDGTMFQAVGGEYPHPFPFGVDENWLTMKCPMGRNHRPFRVEGEFRTDKGKIIVPRKEEVREEEEQKQPEITEEDQQIIEMFKSGMKASLIGEKIGGKTHQYVNTRVRILGLK